MCNKVIYIFVCQVTCYIMGKSTSLIRNALLEQGHNVWKTLASFEKFYAYITNHNVMNLSQLIEKLLKQDLSVTDKVFTQYR